MTNFFTFVRLYSYMSDNPRIGRILQATLKVALLVQVLSLAGCAMAPAYTSEDVVLAAGQGQLEQLFDQVEAELAQAKPGSDKALALDTVKNDVARRLAEPHQATIDALVSDSRTGTLSMAQVTELEAEVATA